MKLYFPQLQAFQSLTGRLKTLEDVADVVGYGVFQSLTGRLKTTPPLLFGREGAMFQSLTGRLKTAARLAQILQTR